MEKRFFDRDISWLSFNERVLLEAAKATVPLLERINFLSIYSSNLDEFYRVRIPALMALQKFKKEKTSQYAAEVLQQATDRVQRQLELFGKILTSQILPLLKENNIHLVYKEAIPANIDNATRDFFFSELLAFANPASLPAAGEEFFPENNRLYFATIIEDHDREKIAIVNVPSSHLPRFFTTQASREHGRLFWFHNNGNDEIYAGSADWVNRNINRRIEVYFPICDESIRNRLKEMLSLQLSDNVQAASIDDETRNAEAGHESEKIRSQEAIYQMIKHGE